MTGQKEKTAPTTKEKTYLALIALVLVAIAVMLLVRPRADAAPANDAAAETEDEQQSVVRERERFVEVEKKITTEILEDGLRDMGVLITQEYYFTEVASYSSVKKFFKTDYAVPFTETSFIVSYDGVVRAGIDLSGVHVEKDDEHKRILVRVPKATIRGTEIDLDSFTLHEEKTGIGNPVSVQDYNNSLRELESAAEQKAIKRGILDNADKNGNTLIRQFIGGFVDLKEYSLVFATN